MNPKKPRIKIRFSLRHYELAQRSRAMQQAGTLKLRTASTSRGHETGFGTAGDIQKGREKHYSNEIEKELKRWYAKGRQGPRPVLAR